MQIVVPRRRNDATHKLSTIGAELVGDTYFGVPVGGGGGTRQEQMQELMVVRVRCHDPLYVPLPIISNLVVAPISRKHDKRHPAEGACRGAVLL